MHPGIWCDANVLSGLCTLSKISWAGIFALSSEVNCRFRTANDISGKEKFLQSFVLKMVKQRWVNWFRNLLWINVSSWHVLSLEVSYSCTYSIERPLVLWAIQSLSQQILFPGKKLNNLIFCSITLFSLYFIAVSFHSIYNVI